MSNSNTFYTYIKNLSEKSPRIYGPEIMYEIPIYF